MWQSTSLDKNKTHYDLIKLFLNKSAILDLISEEGDIAKVGPIKTHVASVLEVSLRPGDHFRPETPP